jgi:hypothetical protein
MCAWFFINTPSHIFYTIATYRLIALHRYCCMTRIHDFSSVLRFRRKNDVCIGLDLNVFPYTVVQHDFHIRWCFVSFNSNSTRVTSGAETANLPEHLSSPRYLVGSCCSASIFLCSVLWIIACPCSVGHYIECPSIYVFWLLIWYLQTFLDYIIFNIIMWIIKL